MTLLAHITTHEVAFVFAVFLFGLVSGYTLAWTRQTAAAAKARQRVK